MKLKILIFFLLLPFICNAQVASEVKSSDGPVKFSDVQITNGNPTNGSIWVATNNIGQGKWVYFNKFSVYSTIAQSITAGVATKLVWNVTNRNDGGYFVTNTWVVDKAGPIFLAAKAFYLNCTANMRYMLYIYKNNSLLRQDMVYAPASGLWAMPKIEAFDVAAPGDTYDIRAWNDVNATNTGESQSCYFFGYQLP